MQNKLQLLSKNKLKFLQSLKNKKYREEHKLFILEGEKFVYDAIRKFPNRIHALIINEDFVENFSSDTLRFECYIAERAMFSKISSLKNYNKTLAVCTIPDHFNMIENQNLHIVLDRIQDPGNLGTILRTCDWFGIQHIYAMKGTADCFNPKVVQASSGSVLNVNVEYVESNELLEKLVDHQFVLLDMNGLPVEDFKKGLDKKYALVLGNEGVGVDPWFYSQNFQKIGIPGDANSFTDSLNAAVSFGVAVSWLKGHSQNEKDA